MCFWSIANSSLLLSNTIILCCHLIDVPSGPEMPGSHSHNDVQGMHHAIRETDPIETSYEQYLRSGVLNLWFVCAWLIFMPFYAQFLDDVLV